MRTWTSSVGTEIEATLAGVEDGKVTLQKADGKSVTLPIDKLSEADRAIVRDYAGNAQSRSEPSPEEASDSARKSLQLARREAVRRQLEETLGKLDEIKKENAQLEADVEEERARNAQLKREHDALRAKLDSR